MVGHVNVKRSLRLKCQGVRIELGTLYTGYYHSMKVQCVLDRIALKNKFYIITLNKHSIPRELRNFT